MAAASTVVDLCDDDDDDDHHRHHQAFAAGRKNNRPSSSGPQVVDLLGDDDDDDLGNHYDSSSDEIKVVDFPIAWTFDDDDDDKNNNNNNNNNRKKKARRRKDPPGLSAVARASAPAIEEKGDGIEILQDKNGSNNHNKNNYKRQRQDHASPSDGDRKPAAKKTPGTSHESEIIDVNHHINARNATWPPPPPPPPPSPPPRTLTPLETVYEVFPDVEDVYVQNLLQEQNNNAPVVLSILADRDYPKRKKTGGNAAGATMAGATNNNMVVKRSKVVPKYDYMSTSSFDPTPTYGLEVLKLLTYDFPFLSQSGIRQLMQQYNNHYAVTRQSIFDTILGKPKQQQQQQQREDENEEITRYHTMKNLIMGMKPSREQRKRLGDDMWISTKRRSSGKPFITDPILQDECVYVQDKLSQWMGNVEQRIKRQQARKESKQSGSAVECSCCFDSVAMEEMVACRDEGHLFCMDCIQQYAESQIFSSGNLGIHKDTKKPASELLCCHGSGCQSGFVQELLQKALPFKTLEKYNELQFQAAIEQAGLGEAMCTCPKCGFQADLPETQMIFTCPMEDCHYESCRKCGKEPHIPLRCDEVVEKKRQDDGRLRVEEAISEAKIRKCPKCKTPFVKSDGCNKMSCPCGVKICYICRSPLDHHNPYSHFCQTAHCTHASCGKCTLYSNADEDDARAMREAGINAAETYRNNLQQENPGANVQIDVDGILHGGTSTTATAHRRHHHQQHHHHHRPPPILHNPNLPVPPMPIIRNERRVRIRRARHR